MKKCPFCHADIEDNARFCVFCMSSLEQKQTIENQPKNNKRWPYILAAFLLLVLVAAITIFALDGNEVNNASGDYITQSEITSEKVSTNQSDISSNEIISNDANTDNSLPENSKDTVTEPDNKGNETSSFNSSQSGNINSEASSNVSTSTPSQSEHQQSDNNNSQSSEEDNTQETITPTQAVYIYRDAVAADCYTEGNIPAQPISDVIVITGVQTAASDGIYTIPQEIDGKRVGAIMHNAFCDLAISKTVKKVVIPATVKTIWQNAFSNCYNLTDIYIAGKTLDIFESAFADKSNRTAQLTIHCAYDCKTFGFYYYRNIADNYDALYQEWNGGEIK